MRIDPSGSCFTSTHLSFARLCLEAREFEAAKPVLDNDVYAFPCTEEIPAYTAAHPYLCSHHDSSSYFITSSSGLTEKLTYKDHLQYFLFGGMIYTGLKDWERALHFYELAIISPVAQKASMIQVEAYKKRILVGILAFGGVSIPFFHPYNLLLTVFDSRYQCQRQPTPTQLRSSDPLRRLTNSSRRSSKSH